MTSCCLVLCMNKVTLSSKLIVLRNSIHDSTWRRDSRLESSMETFESSYATFESLKSSFETFETSIEWYESSFETFETSSKSYKQKFRDVRAEHREGRVSRRLSRVSSRAGRVSRRPSRASSRTSLVSSRTSRVLRRSRQVSRRPGRVSCCTCRISSVHHALWTVKDHNKTLTHWRKIIYNTFITLARVSAPLQVRLHPEKLTVITDVLFLIALQRTAKWNVSLSRGLIWYFW